MASALHLYGAPGELCLSFNGGKDSTVVLHLLLAALAQRARALSSIRIVYFASTEAAASAGAAPQAAQEARSEFPEVLSFMAECERRHGFSIEYLGSISGGGLAALVQQGVRGVLMGTRSTDPDGRFLSGPFTPTSPSWPPVMRVCPIHDWDYATVWQVLRGAALPYCALYDAGFTSLGSVEDSERNPLLLLPCASCPSPCSCTGRGQGCEAQAQAQYLPAWRLEDGSKERLGRKKKSTALAAAPSNSGGSSGGSSSGAQEGLR